MRIGPRRNGSHRGNRLCQNYYLWVPLAYWWKVLNWVLVLILVLGGVGGMYNSMTKNWCDVINYVKKWLAIRFDLWSRRCSANMLLYAMVCYQTMNVTKNGVWGCVVRSRTLARVIEAQWLPVLLCMCGCVPYCPLTGGWLVDLVWNSN